MITSILTGLVVGFIQVGSQTWRTVQVINGQVLKTLLASLVISAGYYISINMLVDNNLAGYVAFSIGAAAATMSIAYSNKPTTGK